MKPTIPSTLLRLLAGALLLGSGISSASAATVTATAAIDWSTFKITPIDTGSGVPSLTWNQQYNNSLTTGESRASLGWSNNLSTSDNQTLPGNTLSASGLSSPEVLVGKSQADFSSPGAYTIAGTAAHFGAFTVHGNGAFLFEASYSLTLATDGLANAPPGTVPNAQFQAGFQLGVILPPGILDVDLNSGIVSLNALHGNRINTTLRDLSFNPATAFTETGTVSVQLAYNDGETGWFYGNAATMLTGNGTQSVVPLPTAVWLLGSSLIGLFGLHRRQQGAA